jgi:hypothetical protein
MPAPNLRWWTVPVWVLLWAGGIGLGLAVFTVFLVLAFEAPLILAGVAVVGTGAVVAARRRRAGRRRTVPGAPSVAPRPGLPPRPGRVWADARDRFEHLRSEYAAFECDIMQVLRLPALVDVSVPSTARFVDAFAHAQALHTDRLPPPAHSAEFVAAVDRAEPAWTAARDAAERIRMSGLSPAERSTLERVIKLLTTARDSDNDPERLAAYGLARSELRRLDRTGVVHLPRTAMAAIDAAAPPALPS